MLVWARPRNRLKKGKFCEKNITQLHQRHLWGVHVTQWGTWASPEQPCSKWLLSSTCPIMHSFQSLQRQFSVLSPAQLKKLHWEENYLHIKYSLWFFFFFGQSGALWRLGCYIKICIRMQCNSIYLWAFYIENSVSSLKHCINISGSDWKGTKRHSFGSSKYESSHTLAGRHGHTARTRRHLHLLTLPAF